MTDGHTLTARIIGCIFSSMCTANYWLPVLQKHAGWVFCFFYLVFPLLLIHKHTPKALHLLQTSSTINMSVTVLRAEVRIYKAVVSRSSPAFFFKSLLMSTIAESHMFSFLPLLSGRGVHQFTFQSSASSFPCTHRD